MIQFYNQWVCVISHGLYVEGQVYLFHEDNPPVEEFFGVLVDENDFPIKVRVRE